MISISHYPDLRIAAFVADWSEAMGNMGREGWLTDLLTLDAPAPIRRSEEVRTAIRNLLRQKGYKPTGRGKPASEYLVKAAEEGQLQPINPAVDVGNAVSLHSGIPISVVDLDKATSPLYIAPGEAGQSYVFNASGHEIDVEGLLCLHDVAGPCANPVKDAQRTKTSEETRRTLTILWSTESLAGATDDAMAWYLALLVRLEAKVDVLLG